eukprot:1153756-Pelagomonas_calceolata.AAC.2
MEYFTAWRSVGTVFASILTYFVESQAALQLFDLDVAGCGHRCDNLRPTVRTAFVMHFSRRKG